MSTNRLSTVLLKTIPLTGCSGSRARPGADPVGCVLSAGEVPSASGVAAHRCAGADGDTGRPWPRMELPLVRRRAKGIGLIHGWYGKPVREVARGVRQDAVKPADSAAGWSPGTLPCGDGIRPFPDCGHGDRHEGDLGTARPGGRLCPARIDLLRTGCGPFAGETRAFPGAPCGSPWRGGLVGLESHVDAVAGRAPPGPLAPPLALPLE